MDQLKAFILVLHVFFFFFLKLFFIFYFLFLKKSDLVVWMDSGLVLVDQV